LPRGKGEQRRLEVGGMRRQADGGGDRHRLRTGAGERAEIGKPDLAPEAGEQVVRQGDGDSGLADPARADDRGESAFVDLGYERACIHVPADHSCQPRGVGWKWRGQGREASRGALHRRDEAIAPAGTVSI
jgi:hypothetical protein